MNFKRIVSAAVVGAGLAAAALVVGTPSRAEEPKPFDAKQTEAIEGIIKSYLMKNPEVLREVIAELNRRQEAAVDESRKKALAQLYKDDSPFATGKGKITMVEFFDYNCGYCRRAFPNLMKLVENEKDFRIVFVEFPVLSDESKFASLAAIAASKQGKYFEFHRAMMMAPGAINEEKVYKIAGDAGLDVNKLKADVKSPETEAILEKNMALGSSMGIQGTPAFFIGDENIPGAPENLTQMLSTAIANIRQKGCSVC